MTEFNMAEVLSTAAHMSPKPRERAFDYTRRLVKAYLADDFPADDWDSLPDEAQQWVNEQIRATNENKQVEEVAGFDDFAEGLRFASATPSKVTNGDATEAEAEAEAEEEENAPKPKVQRAARGTAKAAKEAKPKSAAFQKRADGRVSAIVRAKEMLLEDMALTPVQLLARLESEDYTLALSTVVAVKADFKGTISLLKEKGFTVNL